MFSMFAAAPAEPKVEVEEQKLIDVDNAPVPIANDDDFDLLSDAHEDKIQTAVDADEVPKLQSGFDSEEEDENVMVISTNFTQNYGATSDSNDSLSGSASDPASDDEEKIIGDLSNSAEVKKEEPKAEAQEQPVTVIESLASRLQKAEAKRTECTHIPRLCDNMVLGITTEQRAFSNELGEFEKRIVAKHLQRKAEEEEVARFRSKMLHLLAIFFGLLLFVCFVRGVMEFRSQMKAAEQAIEASQVLEQEVNNLQHKLDDCEQNCKGPSVVQKTIQKAKKGFIFGKCMDVRFNALNRWVKRFGYQMPTEFKLCL